MYTTVISFARAHKRTMAVLFIGGAVAVALLSANFVSSRSDTFRLPSVLDARDVYATEGTNLFLKIDGIEGESRDARHRGEIAIESFSWGEAQTGGGSSTGSGGGAGKVNIQDFHFVMKASKATPKLMIAVANGKHFPKAILTVRKAGGDQQEYLKWKLHDVMVTSYETGGNTGDLLPTDQISLNFSKIEVEYEEQQEGGGTGTVRAGWDLKQNKEF